MDFIYQLGGVSKAPGHLSVKFHNADGDIEFTPAAMQIDGRLTLEHPIFADDFSFLQRQTTTATPKLTIPSRAAAGIVFRRGGDRRTASSSRSTARVPTAPATAAPGLGLAIVRGFVEANGGRVWVESLPSQATSFVVELPVER